MRSPRSEDRSLRRRSPDQDEGRDGVWKESSRDGGRDRGRCTHREQISSHGHERWVDRDRDRERHRERETKRRPREQDDEEREIKRRHREHDDEEREKKRMLREQQEKEEERMRLKQQDDDEREKKRMLREQQDKEEERMRLKRKERASRWDQLDVGKGDASLTGQITETAIPAASVLDAPTAAVQHQIPNPGCSLHAPVQLNSQSDQKVTRCLVLKNVSDPDPSLKEGSKYYKHIRDDIHQICGQHGAVHHVHADGKYGFVYLKFDSVRSATGAQKAFDGKAYKDRVITAHFMETRKYDSMFGTWKR